MIQRSSSGSLQTPGSVHHDSDETADRDAYRNWKIRRNAARQQMRRLSPRELEVVALVSAGLANKSIAQHLQISVKTIEKHRANAARKMNVNSTAEMVRLAVEADQLPDLEERTDEAAAPLRRSGVLPSGSVHHSHVAEHGRGREAAPTERPA